MIEARFRQAFQRNFTAPSDPNLVDQYPTSELDQYQRWQRLVQEVFDDIEDTNQLFNQLWNYYAAPANWLTYDDVRRNWQRILEGGHIIALATNFDSRIQQILAGNPLLKSIQHVFYSGLLGFEKPDRRFFQAIEQHFPAANFTMIGDDVGRDYEPALRQGWNAVLIDRGQTNPLRPSIYSLDEFRL